MQKVSSPDNGISNQKSNKELLKEMEACRFLPEPSAKKEVLRICSILSSRKVNTKTSASRTI